MSLGFVAGTLGLALWALVTWAVSWGRARTGGVFRPAKVRASGWRLFLPVLAGVIMLGFVLGWAHQEPDPPDEQIGLVMLVLDGLSMVVVLRALWRASTALRPIDEAAFPVATGGLFRPRIQLSEAFRERADPEVLQAAMAHERAHARAFDPLRIWLAQLAADLQWPVPGAQRVLQEWLLQLELRRDEEALAAGTAPEALAEAILAAGLLRATRPARLAASLDGVGDPLGIRIRRLLSDTQSVIPPENPLVRGLRGSLLLAAFALAIWLGVRHGEVLIGLLPGIVR